MVALQVVRALFCWIVTVIVAHNRGTSEMYGKRHNYVPLLVRGIMGALSMASYYFALQYLPLADTVRQLPTLRMQVGILERFGFM